jgi:hypothetical protein
MNFKTFLQNPGGLFRRKTTPLKEASTTSSIAYTFILPQTEAQISTSQIVQAILQNPWVKTEKPIIRFIATNEGDMLAEITFYVLKKEKGLAIENEIRSITAQQSE